jgi:hypothetical protein
MCRVFGSLERANLKGISTSKRANEQTSPCRQSPQSPSIHPSIVFRCAQHLTAAAAAACCCGQLCRQQAFIPHSHIHISHHKHHYCIAVAQCRCVCVRACYRLGVGVYVAATVASVPATTSNIVLVTAYHHIMSNRKSKAKRPGINKGFAAHLSAWRGERWVLHTFNQGLSAGVYAFVHLFGTAICTEAHLRVLASNVVHPSANLTHSS